ncbi:MAG: tyrosine-type recombinase/integrase, partial [Pseudonocardiaceae bacterium]
AEDWAATVLPSQRPRVVTLFNYAVQMGVVERNPFGGLGGQRTPGRSEQDPPTEKEMAQLLDACDVLGDYAPRMRALILLGAYTGMRPGELYELRWTDIDLAANRITVSRRLYKGRVDTPKSGKAKRIALPPPARDVLMRQPTRAGDLVFLSKRGCQLCSSTVANYFALVRAAASAPDAWDFYLVTKHYGVALLYRDGLSTRAIAAQMGWSEKAVDGLLRIYGHQDLAALAEVDALYERDANVTQEAGDAL